VRSRDRPDINDLVNKKGVLRGRHRRDGERGRGRREADDGKVLHPMPVGLTDQTDCLVQSSWANVDASRWTT